MEMRIEFDFICVNIPDETSKGVQSCLNINDFVSYISSLPRGAIVSMYITDIYDGNKNL